MSRPPKDLQTAYDVALMMKPLVDHMRASGWAVNLGIEWRDGQRMNLSAELPGAPPSPPPPEKPEAAG